MLTSLTPMPDSLTVGPTADPRRVRTPDGRVLTGLIKRIAPDAEAVTLDDPAAADRLAVPFASATPA